VSCHFYTGLFTDVATLTQYTEAEATDGSWSPANPETITVTGRLDPGGQGEDWGFGKERGSESGTWFSAQYNDAGEALVYKTQDLIDIGGKQYRVTGPPSNLGGRIFRVPVEHVK